MHPPQLFKIMIVLWITPRTPRNIHDARTSNEQNARIRRFYDKPRRFPLSRSHRTFRTYSEPRPFHKPPAPIRKHPPATTNRAPSHPVTDNGRMYVLLSPATGAGITTQTGTPAHPVTSTIAAGASPRGAQPVTSWGAFHFSAPTAEQLQDPTFIPRITRADRVSAANLPAYVREVERQAADSAEARFPRWIWADTRHVDPLLLRRGVRVHLCHDLRLVQRILVTAATHPSGFVEYSPALDLSDVREAVEPQGYLPVARQIQGQEELFGADFLSAPATSSAATATPASTSQSPTDSSPEFLEAAPHEPFAPQLAAGPVTLLPEHPVVRVLMREWLAQARAISESRHPERLRLLAAAESAGALVAAEIGYYGIPFNVQAHHEHLCELLGPRPVPGERPQKMQELAEQIQRMLFMPSLNPDSPQDLLRALQSAGVSVKSTRSWELKSWAEAIPAQRQKRWALIDPILRYKKLYRIWTANGWTWADTWVSEGAFRPHLEVGGAATGRWGASGGGALQLPAEIRQAVQAPEGQVLTVTDGSQIEPRILAALSRDEALASAGRGADLYAGIAELARMKGVGLTERSHAKVGMLAIMYGGRSGEIGALLPHVAALFPQAMDFTERAARIGEAGGQVTTFLGRTSPPVDERFREIVADRSSPAAESRAVSTARAHGRMTRNFIVQGTAAEWALCWMGAVRSRLLSERIFGMPMRTRIVYFLHDELLLCGPELEADRVERIVREGAAEAARLLFGRVPVDFPVSVARVRNYADGK